jgi:hypothetical protein
MYRKRLTAGGKQLAILDCVDNRERYGKQTSIYSVAKQLGYTPNGSFGNSVWSCVDRGYLDARPAGTRGGRFSWQLTVTSKGHTALLSAGRRQLS